MKILLLTGAPGVGKTTVLRKVAAGLSSWKVAGFYTEEIRSTHGDRYGFRMVCFDGRSGVMALADFHGPHRIGKYGVDVAVIGLPPCPWISRQMSTPSKSMVADSIDI